MIRIYKFERLGQLLLHFYELFLVREVIKENFILVFEKKSFFLDLLIDLSQNFGFKYQIQKEHNQVPDTYEYLNKVLKEIGFKVVNTENYCFKNDSFKVINFLLNKLNKKNYCMFLKINKDKILSIEEEIGCRINDCIGISLRYTKPFDIKESNADPIIWNKALNEYTESKKSRPILLLGSDTKIIKSNKKIISLLSLSIYEQLAISQRVRYFIGLSSGFCTAANLYKNPYLIIKSPYHHKEIMSEELLNFVRLPFSSKNQYFDLIIPNSKYILQALNQTNQ